MASQREIVGIWGGAGFAAANALVQAFAILVLAAVNPFNIVEWSTARSREVWQEIQAPDYGKSQSGKDSVGIRDQTTLIYLDEASLDAAHKSLPISIRDEEEIVDQILSGGQTGQGPSAMFVDLLLNHAALGGLTVDQLVSHGDGDATACDRAAANDPKGPNRFHCFLLMVERYTHYDDWKDNPACQQTPLHKLNCIIAKQGIPVIFADGQSRDSQTGAVAMAALRQVALTAPVLTSINAYALAEPTPLKERRRRPYTLSPAAALYAAYCNSAPQTCAQSPISKGAAAGDIDWSADFDTPLLVAWGAGGPDAFTKSVDQMHLGVYDQKCADTNATSNIQRWIGKAFAGVRMTSDPPYCPYTHALPFSDLDILTEADIRTMISGRTVILGGQFQSSNDWVPSPLGGQVPGAYYHAMAFDNLLRYGAHYPKIATPIPFLAVSAEDCITALVALAIVFWSGLATPILNQDRFDPYAARGARPVSIRLGSRWGLRILAGAGLMVPIAIFGLLLDAKLFQAFPNFNSAAIMVLTGVAIFEMTGLIARPLFEEGGRRFRFFDLEDIKLGRPKGRGARRPGSSIPQSPSQPPAATPPTEGPGS